MCGESRVRFGSFVRGAFSELCEITEGTCAYLARKEDKGLQAAEKAKWKKIHQSLKSQPHR